MSVFFKFSLLFMTTLCVFESIQCQQFKEKDIIWMSGHNLKPIHKVRHARQVWNVQNDMPPQQPSAPHPMASPPNSGPVLPAMRHHHCDQEVSTIGKRSVQSMDSFPNLINFFMNEENSDVTLVVNGTKIPAHRFVLMAKSSKFAQMFKENPDQKEFDLGTESADSFKTLLKYFYTERFTLEDESDHRKAIEIYKLAQQYGMNGLTEQIQRALAKMIFLNNYLDIYKFAVENEMHELVKLWMGFVFANTQQIINEESFMNESVNIVQKVLGALNVPSSYVLSKIKRLIEDNPELNAQHFRSIVYLERCSVDDLISLAELKLYDEKFLFEDMVKRYHALEVSCRPAPRNVPRWISPHL